MSLVVELPVSRLGCRKRLILWGESLSLSLSRSRHLANGVGVEWLFVTIVVDELVLDDVVVVGLDIMVVTVELECADERDEDDTVVDIKGNKLLDGTLSACLEPRVFVDIEFGSLSRSLSFDDKLPGDFDVAAGSGSLQELTFLTVC